MNSFLLRDRANINLENLKKVLHISIEQTPILISDICMYNREINLVQSKNLQKNLIDHSKLRL